MIEIKQYVQENLMIQSYRYISSLWIFIVLSLFLVGCGSLTAVGDVPRSDLPTNQVLRATATPTPSSAPAFTHTPSPTATPAPTSTDTPTPTPTLHPMSIQAMRLGDYPGSQIVIEQELEPGSNYHRYYASYLSEGLKIYALLTIPNGEAPSTGWPAIVFNHGYIPPAQYRTTERYIAYVDNLARSGYIVFRIDYRGHDRSEGLASGAYGSPGYTIDVLNAVAALSSLLKQILSASACGAIPWAAT
jgi:uncharacterized protein